MKNFKINFKKILKQPITIYIMVFIISFICTTTLVKAKTTINYTSLNVPAINSSWKTWMDYKCIAKGSTQRNFIDKWAYVDSNGFMRCRGEKDLGITDDYYCIALGGYYGRTIGTKYKFTTNTGNVFYGVLSEFKDISETNKYFQYGYRNKDIIEFLIYTPKLHKDVKLYGTANVYMPLNGSITKIERMDFVN